MSDVPEDDILDHDSITLEHLVTKVMVTLSFAFLVLVAAILPQATINTGEELQTDARQMCIYAILALWALFIVEFVIQGLVFRSFSSRKRRAIAFGVVLVPPLRLAIRPGATPDHLWIPFLGWQRANKALRKRLEAHFSAPMMLIAMMILPILGLEFFWTEELQQSSWRDTAVNMGTRIIWLAFAIEFLVMISVSKKRVTYCRVHWIDLAIILLPLISFLRAFRLLRLGRLVKLQKMSRIYRLRGLAFRALRAVLILRVLDRVSHRFAKKRLDHLRGTVSLKQEEIKELHVEIAVMEDNIEQMTKEREARAAEKGVKKAGNASD